jgi:hypothetical protein
LWAECNTCEAGSYVQNGIEIVDFSSFPSKYNFTTQCLIKDNFSKETDCMYSKGFIASGIDGLVAGHLESYGS